MWFNLTRTILGEKRRAGEGQEVSGIGMAMGWGNPPLIPIPDTRNPPPSPCSYPIPGGYSSKLPNPNPIGYLETSGIPIVIKVLI